MSLINFLYLIVSLEIDFLINGFFIYKNPFIKKLIFGAIKTFFIGVTFFFIPIRYGFLLIILYFSFYLGIVLILLIKNQYPECVDFLGKLFLQQKKILINQINIHSQFNLFIINLFQVRGQSIINKKEKLDKKIKDLEEQILGDKKK